MLYESGQTWIQTATWLFGGGIQLWSSISSFYITSCLPYLPLLEARFMSQLTPVAVSLFCGTDIFFSCITIFLLVSFLCSHLETVCKMGLERCYANKLVTSQISRQSAWFCQRQRTYVQFNNKCLNQKQRVWICFTVKSLSFRVIEKDITFGFVDSKRWKIHNVVIH